jgi:hypothetical protein
MSASSARLRGAIVGCALGVCLASGACAERPLPKATLVYRHERDSGLRDHRVEVWLSHSPRPREASAGLELELEPMVMLLDPCPDRPFCDARDLLVEEAERRYLWVDPLLEDDALERRLDDVMPIPLEELAGLEEEEEEAP